MASVSYRVPSLDRIDALALRLRLLMACVLVFDVDNTLTPPRQPLHSSMAACLGSLPVPFHLAAGSDLPLVLEQVVRPLHAAGYRGELNAFVCNGADRYVCRLGTDVAIESVCSFRLRDYLGVGEFAALCSVLQGVLDAPEFSLQGSGVVVRGPRLIDRGSMINLAPMGRPSSLQASDYRNRAAFVAFDRRTGFRQRMLARLREALAPWQERFGLRVTLGGETSFDIVVRGYDKSFPLRVLLEEGASEVLYFGDALHPLGNDAVVLEFIEQWSGPDRCPVRAVPVRDWQDTLQQVQGMLPDLGARSDRAAAPQEGR